MNAAYLTPEQREVFTRLIIGRRDSVGTCIRRMEQRGWYSDDPAYQCLKSAYHSLHGAVQVLGAMKDAPVKKKIERPPPTPDVGHLMPRPGVPPHDYGAGRRRR